MEMRVSASGMWLSVLVCRSYTRTLRSQVVACRGGRYLSLVVSEF